MVVCVDDLVLWLPPRLNPRQVFDSLWYVALIADDPCSLLVWQMACQDDEVIGRVSNQFMPSPSEREDNLRAVARDMASPGGFGLPSPTESGARRRHRSGRTFSPVGSDAVSSPAARVGPPSDLETHGAGAYVTGGDGGAALSPGSVALASRFTRAPYDPSMVRPCLREHSYVEGGRRISYAISPAADYDMSVLDIVIAGSLRGLHVVEVVEEDRDHCVVRVFRSPPREEGMLVCIIAVCE